MIISRLNSIGLTFHIQGLDKDTSEIIDIRNDNRVVIHFSVEDISQMWYNWQMRGEYIQVAFSQFTPEEREFILTGITPEEWNKIFNSNGEEY